ncbi:MAG: RNA methyltransferase [Nitrospirota bacterium]
MQQSSPHKPITSKDNSIIKYLRALSDPKFRRKEQVFLIEGVKMVEEALRDKVGVTTVVASPALVQHHGKGVLKLAEARSIDILWIAERLVDAISESKTPQPVMAIVKMKEHSEDELFDHASKLIIICHQLQDPGNLGTIIRTVEAVGAAGIVLAPSTVDPYSAKAIRASMGSILRLPVVRVGNANEFLKLCKQRGFQTIAAVVTGDKSHFALDLKKPTVIVLGQEGAGLPQDIMAEVDLRVRIPMVEAIDSLNVAVSAAAVLYEAVRQRM